MLWTLKGSARTALRLRLRFDICERTKYLLRVTSLSDIVVKSTNDSDLARVAASSFSGAFAFGHGPRLYCLCGICASRKVWKKEAPDIVRFLIVSNVAVGLLAFPRELMLVLRRRHSTLTYFRYQQTKSVLEATRCLEEDQIPKTTLLRARLNSRPCLVMYLRGTKAWALLFSIGR